MKSKHDQIRKERGLRYGPVKEGHDNLGLIWTGLLQDHYQIVLSHPIPSHIACLMLSGLKLSRAARPFRYDRDDYDDERNYTNFAQETDPRNPEATNGVSRRPEVVRKARATPRRIRRGSA